MNLRHEAILSLNTRVRRLRYLYKSIDFVSDSSVSPQLLVNQLVKFGLSQLLYDEIVKTPSEPYSGHFFENVSQSYEWNINKRETRRNSNAERVAESYIELGINLGLLVQSDQRISPSQLSMPLRFISAATWLPAELQMESRNRYLLALLWRYDRDLTCPLLLELLHTSAGISMEQIETGWDGWTNRWLDCLIRTSSKLGLGNPAELLRYGLISSKGRKNTRRYAEHIALIRFHWFIDLGLAIGVPSKNPAEFCPAGNQFGHIEKLLAEPSSYLIAGDIARIHFDICKAVSSGTKYVGAKIKFSKFKSEFLKAAQIKGMSNIRLNLLDIAWTSIASVTGCLPANFSELCEGIDDLLKAEGVTVVKAPRREDSYIPTRQ
jgi:hypothetical protein